MTGQHQCFCGARCWEDCACGADWSCPDCKGKDEMILSMHEERLTMQREIQALKVLMGKHYVCQDCKAKDAEVARLRAVLDRVEDEMAVGGFGETSDEDALGTARHQRRLREDVGKALRGNA